MFAIGYVRVSTEQQSTDGVSLESQQSRIRAYCEANGVTLQAMFCDAGVSGKRADNRPELQKALAAVSGCKGVLVVYSLSRLARSTKDTIAIAERLEHAGADLASLSERIDTSSAAGKMVFRMLAVLNEFERDQVSERTKTALQHKKSKGERVGKLPYGYDLATDGVQLVPNETEQTVLMMIRDWHKSGRSLRSIADELTMRQIPTKDGKSRWLHSTIAYMLKHANAV